MDRRSFLTMGTVGAAALTGHRLLGAPSGPTTRVAEAPLWAANFANAKDSDQAGFGNVQSQRGGGGIENGGPPIPAVDHPKLGRALKITLDEGDERLEAAPGFGDKCGEGDDYFFRVDFALDKDFPVDQRDYFCLVNQIHHGGDSGSPPIEFDVHENTFWVRGNSDSYNEKLCPIAVDTTYSLVYHVHFSTDPDRSLLEVWVNGKQLLKDYHPACATMYGGGDSYWKGATMYCSPDIPPLTVYQNAHRVGASYASVTS